MNKHQRKMFINAMLEWLLLLVIFITLTILQLCNIDWVLGTFQEVNNYGLVDKVLVYGLMPMPLIASIVIIKWVILPCYKSILKGEIW